MIEPFHDGYFYRYGVVLVKYPLQEHRFGGDVLLSYYPFLGTAYRGDARLHGAPPVKVIALVCALAGFIAGANDFLSGTRSVGRTSIAKRFQFTWNHIDSRKYFCTE